MFIAYNIPSVCQADLTVSSAKIANYDGLKRELITFNSVFTKISFLAPTKGNHTTVVLPMIP